MPTSPPPSQEELDALEKEIAERFPGWTFIGVGAGYGEHYLAAEKIGTIPDRQYGSSPRMLLEAIKQREEQQSRSRVVAVETGPQSALNAGEAVAMMLGAAADYASDPSQETFERFELACNVYAVRASKVGPAQSGSAQRTNGVCPPSETPDAPTPADNIATRTHG